MHSHIQHITPRYIHNTPHSTTAQTRQLVASLGLRVWCWCMGGVCFVFVVCIVRVLGSVVCVFRVVSVVLCRVVISLVVLPLVSVVLSLLRCVSVFCASCAFWCTHQHMVIVCRVCVVCVLGSAVSRLLEHVIRNQSSGFLGGVRSQA